MYRQLTVTHFSFNNIKLFTKNFIFKDQNKCTNRSKFYSLVKDYETFNNNIKVNALSTNPRFNSSQQINTEFENAEVPKKKHKYGKYVELLEVGLTTKQIRARVRSLRSKKLTDFIEKSDYLINRHSGNYLVSQLERNVEIEKTKIRAQKRKNRNEERINRNNSIKLSNTNNNDSNNYKLTKKAQPLEYRKFDIEMFESNIFQPKEYDNKPLIFFCNENPQINSEVENRIITSFNNFKELIENIKDEQEDESSTNLEFQKDLYDPEISEAIDDGIVAAPEIDKVCLVKNTMKATEKLKFKSKIHKSLEQENLAKLKTIFINLSTYINVCVTNGMLNCAFSTIWIYRERCKKFDFASNDFTSIPIDTYNVLMHGYAKNAELNKIERIIQIIKEDNIKPNYQTFASIFECLGRVEENDENKKLISKYRDKAFKYGLNLNDIVDKSKFQFDELEIVLDAIRRIEPEFEPNFTEPNLNYSNPMLYSLNNNVEKNKDINTINNSNYTKEEILNFAKEQLKIELDGSVNIKSIEKSPNFQNFKEYGNKINDLNVLWKSQICAAISRDLNALKAQMKHKPNGNMTYYTYLKSLDAKLYADVLLQEIRKLAEGSETFSPTVGQLFKELGQKVESRYHIELKKRNGVLIKTGEIYSQYCQELENRNNDINSRILWQNLIHKNRLNGPSMDINDVTWPKAALIGVGRFLYNILMRDIKIDSNILKNNTTNSKKNLLPAFYTLYRNHGRLVKEEVKPHPILARLIRASQQKILTFSANEVPMVCPPQPWSTPVNGGYLLTKSDLLRLPQQAIQQLSRISEMSTEEIYPALDSLNQLSSVAWRVNQDILDVILEVFRNGGDNKLDVPESPSNLPPLPSIPKKSTLSNIEKARLFKEKLMHRRKQSEMYSLWCDTLYRLSLANHYRDRVFWLPHNMDFRGRVYPIPPHLNHLGSDLARSMLVFDKKRPLGPDGLTWLKLHCINLTGLKKRDSIRERILYAEQILDEILDSADNPLNGRKWWTKSDAPWQTLACCIEIAKVLKTPNPEEFMSGFPIHQDGSCNGLQHYAALGRDRAGAFSVNLSPSEKPQDVYSAIATLVEKTRETDAKNGLHIAQILEGYVRRKVIKQTVMTTVYGVTRYGARLQIARQLKDIEDFPKECVWPASTYLTIKTFESLREMFTSAKEIQDWFTDCARFISATNMENVEWVTPLGLPVVQPYNRTAQFKSVKSSRIDETLSLDMYEKPNVIKQKNAFPPNFIHSLDSSHMMLTSLYCERNGVTFISVHDCFWTHACTVPDMNKICREQFVALHSQPILENLSRFLIDKYSLNKSDLSNDSQMSKTLKLSEILKQVPRKGDFDLQNVLNSIYFFS